MTSCSATVGHTPESFGFRPIVCRQQVGVRVFVTTGGLRVGYCSREGHEANVRRRFEERQEPPEPQWYEMEEAAHEAHGGDESRDRDCVICQGGLNDFLRYGETIVYATGMTYTRWLAESER